MGWLLWQREVLATVVLFRLYDPPAICTCCTYEHIIFDRFWLDRVVWMEQPEPLKMSLLVEATLNRDGGPSFSVCGIDHRREVVMHRGADDGEELVNAGDWFPWRRVLFIVLLCTSL